MKHSEFWRSVETVFGAAYGASLAQDLVLPVLGRTCVEALAAGVAPQDVWTALCEETEVPQESRWVFRQAPRR